MSFLVRLLGFLLVMASGYVIGVTAATGNNPAEALAHGQYLNANPAVEYALIFATGFLGSMLSRAGLRAKS